LISESGPDGGVAREAEVGEIVPAITTKDEEEELTIERFLEAVQENDQSYSLLKYLYPFMTGKHKHHDLMLLANCSKQDL
jgi:hypothetical protein